MRPPPHWIIVADQSEDKRFEYLICAPVEIRDRVARYEVFGRVTDYTEATREVYKLNSQREELE